jgi:hypothetical protein
MNPSRITFGDWALLAISIAFVVCGAFVLPRDRNVGITTIVFFGACGLVALGVILRKRREQALQGASVQVTGGVPIRPSPRRMQLLGAGLLAVGATLLWFGPQADMLVRVCCWIMAVVGAAVLLISLAGLTGNQYLQFEPDALVLGYRSWSVAIPWDQVAQVAAGELSRNPALCLWIASPEACKIVPPEKEDAFLKSISQCRAWMGADVCVITTHYDVPLPVLVTAIERYRSSQAARAELAAAYLPGLT